MILKNKHMGHQKLCMLCTQSIFASNLPPKQKILDETLYVSDSYHFLDLSPVSQKGQGEGLGIQRSCMYQLNYSCEGGQDLCMSFNAHGGDGNSIVLF